MHLTHVKSATRHEAVIESVSAEEVKSIKKSGRFGFDWEKEIKYEMYKLRLKNSDEVLGLMSLIDVPGEFRMEIHLLESSKENISKKKEYDGIAGCLIAFACGISFNRNYYGFISLIPKTILRQYYIDEYGMEDAGLQLFSDTENSAKLMNKYLFK